MAEPGLAFGLPQHPNQQRPEGAVLLAVDQELGEGAAGPLEVGEHQDVEEARRGEPDRGCPSAPRQASTRREDGVQLEAMGVVGAPVPEVSQEPVHIGDR